MHLVTDFFYRREEVNLVPITLFKLFTSYPTVAETVTPSIFSLPCRSEGPDEPVPVLSVHGRRHVRRLYLSGRLQLSGPLLQAGSPDLVEVVSAQQSSRSG